MIAPRPEVRQFHAFTGDEGRAAVGELNDDRCFNFAAVSRTALMESVPTQLTAGRVKLFSLPNTFFWYVITSDHARFYGEIKNFVTCFVVPYRRALGKHGRPECQILRRGINGQESRP